MNSEAKDKTTVEILTSARQNLSEEKNWTREVYARDKDGYSVGELEATAVCFCSLGAIRKAVPDNNYKGYNNARDALYETIKAEHKPFLTVHAFNDHIDTTHADVLALFDTTIKRLSE